jgi:hypothetical protein
VIHRIGFRVNVCAQRLDCLEDYPAMTNRADTDFLPLRQLRPDALINFFLAKGGLILS